MGGMLLGGAALAQQGLIIDPWDRHAPRALTPLDVTGAATKAQRAPSDVVSGAQTGLKLRLHEADSGPDSKWNPGVTVDLVDPWVRVRAAQVATTGGRNWAKPLVDLVDPWATERDSSATRAPVRSSIY